ncbi:MAG: hypothetical protein OIF58_11660 [Cohaesibacter sp.]|nr:hypothetical protein [Cohaesibacter sp.]
MQVSVHWEEINAANVGDGDIGLKIVHPPTNSVIVVDADVVVDEDEDEAVVEEVLELGM